jgi:hypothetical protein
MAAIAPVQPAATPRKKLEKRAVPGRSQALRRAFQLAFLWPPGQPEGRKIIAHGVSRVGPVDSLRSPGTGRKIRSFDRNIQTPAGG